MNLHELLRDCFNENDLKMFLFDEFSDSGKDVWDSTDGAWKSRVFDICEKLEQAGMVGRPLFEALIKARPGRADDIAAVCRTATGQPLSYAVGKCPDSEVFPWSQYKDGMSPGAIELLKFAAYDARSRGFRKISTTEVVRVYSAMQPWVTASLKFDDIEPCPLLDKEDPFDDQLGASYCVSKTFHGLAMNTEHPDRFTEHDIFLDLVRFGSGTSARKIAPDGAALDNVNQLSRDLEIGRTTRHARLAEAGTG